MKNKDRKEARGHDHRSEIKRLNRIMGQVDGVRRMLEENRRLSDVLMQCKAIHSALRSIESRIVRAHLEAALDEIERLDKRKHREERIDELEELFRHAG